MIKILIVDDEDFIRHGMRYAIPWEENGLEVVGEAGNGEEALKLCVQLAPDIVLADIQMPLMDGLELARKLNDLMPDTKVIILTAYGNTENLTSAIDVKVSSFLLKSADSGQILQTVLKVKAKLEDEQVKSSQVKQLKDIYEENRHLIKATLLVRFLQSQISYSHFVKKSEKIGLDLSDGAYSMALIKTNCEDEKTVLGNLLHHFRKFHPFAFFVQDCHAVVILDTRELPLSDSVIGDILPGILPVTFGNGIVIMNDIASGEEFPLVYRVLNQALEHCFWNISEPYTLLTPRDRIVTGAPVEPYTYESEVISAILARSAAEIQSRLDRYYNYMETLKSSRQTFLDSIKRLTVLIGAVSEEKLDVSRINKLIGELETPREIIDLIASLAMPDQGNSPSLSLIEPALEFIRLHYMEDIHLEEAAKAAYLSAGYLSRIFKTETGFSFKEYIHCIRIGKAQELVCKTDLKYYEIAEKVGYKDYKYFSSYFNKITGCSAKEYRMSHPNFGPS